MARIVSAGVLLGAVWSALASDDAAVPGRERQQALVRMVRQDCGSCHGLTLKGGLGPALLPAALRDRPVDGLRYTILLGRPGTAMPPWQGLLTDGEARWIANQLVAGFPEERSR